MLHLPLELREIMQRMRDEQILQIVADNARMPFISATESAATNEIPPLSLYRVARLPRRRRARKPVPPEKLSRWDACCPSPVKSSTLSSPVKSPTFSAMEMKRKLLHSSLVTECNTVCCPNLLYTTIAITAVDAAPLKMPVRRFSIETNKSIDADILQLEKSELKEVHMSLPSTSVKTTIREQHLQRMEIRKMKQQRGDDEAEPVQQSKRRHSFELYNSRRRVDTAMVLDEALSLMSLGV